MTELKSKLSVMLKRLATGIAIFFIPTIVNFVIVFFSQLFPPLFHTP